MRDRDKIVFLATAWGPTKGGINAFNADICLAMPRATSARVVCVVPYVRSEIVRQLSSTRLEVISAGLSDGENLSSATEVLKELAASKTVLWWIGHDTVTGPLALELREQTPGSTCAIIHHMNYIAYKTLQDGAGAVDEHHVEQHTVLRAADRVLAVGPKLRDSANDLMRGTHTGQ